MAFLHNIRTIARYEAKTLRRSWFFRLFSLGSLMIFTFLNLGLFSPVGDESWELVSISSSVPLINLYLLNIVQAVVVIFLASDFLKRDKKIDTNEVLYTRSMSNFEYITGKTWGILRLFLGLDILILCIALLMNVISKSMSVDIMSYIYYLLIICVPTLLFSLGLSFMLMSVIRNQAVTFLLLLGFAALNIFWLWYRFGSIFDYMAFGLPVFKSGVTGFGNSDLILNQRLLYTFFGLALILSTVLLFKRLPQSKVFMTISVTFMFFFMAGAALCGFNTYKLYKNTVDDKAQIIETNHEFEDRDFVRLTDAAIDFKHKGDTFEASAGLKFINHNDKELNTYLFSLNPGLKIKSVSSGGRDLSFKRKQHIIEIDPGKTLSPGLADSIFISYSGTINESFCYPNYSEDLNETPYRIEMLNVDKRQSFLSGNYVLLTPETNWYPVPGLNYYPSNPARIKVDFTRFTLRVETMNGLAAVSQGLPKIENGLYLYNAGVPLSGLTLAIGDYLTDTLRVDSVTYVNCHFRGNDYYKKDLAEIKDTLNSLISGIMRELESNFSTKYPFNTLTLLEVPVHYYSLPKMNTRTRAELQPSMVLLPERLSTLQNAGFGKQFTRQKRRMERNNQVITDKELQVRLFNNFVRSTFISGQNFRYVNGVAWNEPVRFLLGPSFYFFKNNFYSNEYPVLNAVFESHLQQVTTPGNDPDFQAMSGSLSDNDKANIILRDYSLREMLEKNPGGDTLRHIMSIKGDYLFNLFRAKAGIEEFNEWFSKYIDDNTFRSVDIKRMNDDMKDRFGFGFYPYLKEWFEGKGQPGFLISDVRVNEIISGNRSRYHVTFIISNPEPVTGLCNLSFRTGGPGAPGSGSPRITTMIQAGGPGGGRISIARQGRGMEASDISKVIMLGPSEARRIGMIVDAQPRAILFNTLFSKNIPGVLNIPVSEIIKSKNTLSPSYEEDRPVPIPQESDTEEIIVDNEDPGFSIGDSITRSDSPLKRFLKVNKGKGVEYDEINRYWAPETWRQTVQSAYYGRYILSSVYTRGGSGDRSVSWKTKIDEPAYYDIYCYIGKTADQITVSRGGRGGPAGTPPQGGQAGRPQGESPYKDMHYIIYHADGMNEIEVDFEGADAGWNNLGRYYLSDDSAKVELTNKSSGRIVLGDAIRWVKTE